MDKGTLPSNMLRVIYTGPTREVSRFGICRKGDELRMMFHEALYTAMHKPAHWTVVDVPERVPDGHDVLPFATPHFDLRVLNWFDFERLFPQLDRTAMARLEQIAEAVNFVGGYVCMHRDVSRTEIVDAICFNAWRFSWDKLDVDATHALPEIDTARTMWDKRGEKDDVDEKPKTKRKRTRRRRTTAKS